MANIKTYLNNIKGALYGKDVRDSIHDAIEQCYTDASINGNANMEVTQARGGHETLGERLDGHASQLAYKADKSYVDNKIQSVASGSPKGVYHSVSDLITAFPTGNSNIYIVSGDGGWYYWNSTTWVKGGMYQASSFSTYKGQLTKSDNIDDFRNEGVYLVTKANTPGTYPNDASTYLLVENEGTNSFVKQIITNIDKGNPKQWVRSWLSDGWSAWVETTAQTKTYKRSLQTDDNIDSLFSEGQYWLNSVTTTQGTFPTGISMYSIIDVKGVGSNWVTQTITTTTGGNVRVFVRSYYNKWCDWVELTKTTSFNTLPSVWNGKKANFIGDSITQGSYGNYVNVVKEILGLDTARNYGVGGGRLASTDQDLNYTPVVDRYMDMDDDADIIFMLIGTNDYASQVPIGLDNSTTKTEFKGALNIVLTGLREKYPDKLIIVATQIHRFNDNQLEIKMSEYRQATKDICDKQRVICFDLYNATGFDFAKGYYDKVLTTDGLHPNQKGADIIGRKIAGFINQM